MTLVRPLIIALLFLVNTSLLANAAAPLLRTQDSCLSAIESAEKSHRSSTPKRINVLSWNVHKFTNEAAIKEVIDYTRSNNILFLQEAVRSKELIDSKPFTSFSVGYQTVRLISGVLTLSDYPIVISCSYMHTEPWLRTPKVTNVVLLNIDGTLLLAANIHAINFTLRTKYFSTQLHSIQEILVAHKGPVIFSGDFNTWSNQRLKVLNGVATTANLTQVEFKEDLRKQVFGVSLDRIFIRDIKIIESRTKASKASDHNPIFATLELVPSE
ncbi:MAG TPA: endonuclease/exonuclease/phosphatase family protein [Cellvibrio sp.]|nr:endonuclease/exonuclease/phosphatase family protein [Cellvibrio sp.]